MKVYPWACIVSMPWRGVAWCRVKPHTLSMTVSTCPNLRKCSFTCALEISVGTACMRRMRPRAPQVGMRTRVYVLLPVGAWLLRFESAVLTAVPNPIHQPSAYRQKINKLSTIANGTARNQQCCPDVMMLNAMQ